MMNHINSDLLRDSFPALMGSPTMYPGLPLNFTDFLFPLASRNCVSKVWVSGRESAESGTETRSNDAVILLIPSIPFQSMVYRTSTTSSSSKVYKKLIRR